jgi:tetratricopeptide (TPR) repeat protein
MALQHLMIAAALAPAEAPAASSVFYGELYARDCYDAAVIGTSPGDGIAICNRALAQDPLSLEDEVATYVNRGILKSRLGDTAAAIADFDAALAKDPGEADAYLNKAIALSRSPGGWEQALPLFDLAIAKRATKLALAYLGRGYAHERLGDVAAAYRDYSQANALAPEWPQPLAELARFSVRRK